MTPDRTRFEFVVVEQCAGFLISLSQLLEALKLRGVKTWRLRYVEAHGVGRPLGMDFSEFEREMQLPSGLEVSDSQFRLFLAANYQICDGVFEVWTDEPVPNCVVSIICDDGASWEITTSHHELADQFTRLGRQSPQDG